MTSKKKLIADEMLALYILLLNYFLYHLGVKVIERQLSNSIREALDEAILDAHTQSYFYDLVHKDDENDYDDYERKEVCAGIMRDLFSQIDDITQLVVALVPHYRDIMENEDRLNDMIERVIYHTLKDKIHRQVYKQAFLKSVQAYLA